jgi:hypothetical protein
MSVGAVRAELALAGGLFEEVLALLCLEVVVGYVQHFHLNIYR